MVDSIKVSPEIFVGLKEDGVGKYYKIGAILGEGNVCLSNFFCIFLYYLLNT